jgi:uncharacterized protein (UPF0335 family)
MTYNDVIAGLITDDELAELDKAEKEATKDWFAHDLVSDWDTPVIGSSTGGLLFKSTHHGNMREDAKLIVLARNSMRKLLNEVARLREEREYYKSEAATFFADARKANLEIDTLSSIVKLRGDYVECLQKELAAFKAELDNVRDTIEAERDQLRIELEALKRSKSISDTEKQG